MYFVALRCPRVQSKYEEVRAVANDVSKYVGAVVGGRDKKERDLLFVQGTRIYIYLYFHIFNILYRGGHRSVGGFEAIPMFLSTLCLSSFPTVVTCILMRAAVRIGAAPAGLVEDGDSLALWVHKLSFAKNALCSQEPLVASCS